MNAKASILCIFALIIATVAAIPVKLKRREAVAASGSTGDTAKEATAATKSTYTASDCKVILPGIEISSAQKDNDGWISPGYCLISTGKRGPVMVLMMTFTGQLVFFEKETGNVVWKPVMDLSKIDKDHPYDIHCRIQAFDGNFVWYVAAC